MIKDDEWIVDIDEHQSIDISFGLYHKDKGDLYKTYQTDFSEIIKQEKLGVE